MTGWIVVWALGVLAVLGTAASRHYHWVSGWRYDWTRARHILDETAGSVPPGEEWGSMIYAEDPHGEEIVARVARYGDIAGPPDGLTWREQTMTDLAPESLLDETGVLCAGCAGFDHCDGIEGACLCTCGWPEDWAEADDDPGPEGGLVSSSPPPGPDQRLCGPEQPHEKPAGTESAGSGHLPPTRLADTGEIRDAHLLADVTAELRAQDDDTAAYLSRLRSDCLRYRLDVAAALT